MAKQTRATLKAWQNAGFKPSEGGMDDLIDTLVSLHEDAASAAEVQAGVVVDKFLNPANLVERTATETRTGLVELATTAEAAGGADTDRAVTAAGLAAYCPAASTTAAGKAELATDAEAKLAADPGKVLSPDNLSQGAPAVTGTLEAMFFQHYQFDPAVDASGDAVHAAINQVAGSTTVVTTAITNPDFPRLLSITGGIAGQTGNVVIAGTNIKGDAITDTIALNGTTLVNGVKAFRTVTSITCPAETHTSAAQVETAVAAGTITGPGNASVTVTASGMTGSGTPILVAVLTNDTAAQWAAKVRAALELNAGVTAMFTVGGADENIVLTRKICAANDGTLNIALANGSCTGITEDATSNNTTAGVAYDTVKVGVVKTFGMPHIITNAALLLVKLFDGSTDSGTLAVDADEIEKNLFALNGTPDGAKLVDLYYLV